MLMNHRQKTHTCYKLQCTALNRANRANCLYTALSFPRSLLSPDDVVYMVFLFDYSLHSLGVFRHILICVL